MVSTWDHSRFRKNDYVDTLWKGCFKVTKEHFYHVGAKEKNRNAVTEALLMNYDPGKIAENIAPGREDKVACSEELNR